MKQRFEKMYFDDFKFKEVYAIIYKNCRLILYNTNFEGEKKLFIIAPEEKDRKEMWDALQKYR